MFDKKQNGLLKPIFIIFVICLVAIVASAIASVARHETYANGFIEKSTVNVDETTTLGYEVDENGDPVVVSTAKIGSAGDILIHKPILQNAYISSEKTYNFDNVFSYINPVIKKYDYFVANLELSCGGSERGYSTYPLFNIPDTIVDAAKKAGIDCLLTSNNHCYDSSEAGVLRTQEVIKKAGVDYTGTVTSSEQDNYLVKEINGIKFGFVCYTFETDSETGTAINGIKITDTAASLINTFHYSTLDKFYTKLGSQLNSMKNKGADVLVVYIHWGDEYQLKQNSRQTEISQKLADMGVDVIVGGHPHVVQPVDLITSTDGAHKTVCVYSLGNFISNQRRALMSLKDGHTEDGMIFEMSFSKYSDGSVKFDSVGVIPTWVHLFASGGRNVYRITPLAKGFSDKAEEIGLKNSSNGLSLAEDSYDRTMALVSEGMDKCNAYLKNKTANDVSETQSDVSRSDDSQSDVSQPDASQSYASEPDTSQSDASQSSALAA